jgi:membrane protein DedA with SNARE-associated domain
MLASVLHVASVSDTLAGTATDLIADIGLLGIFVLMLLDAACVPIPSEVTMLFGGFTVSQGHNGLLWVVVVGVLGNVIGSWLAYAIGRYGRRLAGGRQRTRRIFARRHLDAAERWFRRYGDASVLVARLLPVVRTFISLPAGAAGMPWRRFTALTAVGCVPWVFAFAWLGSILGANWTSLRPGLQYADYVVAALAVAAVAWLLARRARRPLGP